MEITLVEATRQVGHSCRQRTFLRIAGGLGLSAPWTQADVDAIKVARRFQPGVAARQIGMLAPAFLLKAAEIGLGEPPHTQAEIHQVRDASTDDFPGITTRQMAEMLQIDVEWVRRKAREFNIGKKADPGCYMLDGQRVRRPTPSRYFTEADVPLLLEVLPEDAHTFPLKVKKSIYHVANQVAQTDGDPRTGPGDVMVTWLENAAKAIVPG